MEGLEDRFVGVTGDGAIYKMRGKVGEETGLEGMFFVAGARGRGYGRIGGVVGLKCSR